MVQEVMVIYNRSHTNHAQLQPFCHMLHANINMFSNCLHTHRNLDLPVETLMVTCNSILSHTSYIIDLSILHLLIVFNAETTNITSCTK